MVQLLSGPIVDTPVKKRVADEFTTRFDFRGRVQHAKMALYRLSIYLTITLGKRTETSLVIAPLVTISFLINPYVFVTSVYAFERQTFQIMVDLKNKLRRVTIFHRLLRCKRTTPCGTNVPDTAYF